jgi:hypothetical protein
LADEIGEPDNLGQPGAPTPTIAKKVARVPKTAVANNIKVFWCIVICFYQK